MIGILSCIALIAAVNAMAMDKDLKFKGLMSDIVQKPLFYHEEMRNVSYCLYIFLYFAHKIYLYV